MEVLVLASSSPRRKELLHKITDDFIVRSPSCEEIETGDPVSVAIKNATLKGRATEGNFVLACDTVVELDGVIYGKPEDNEDAKRMLSALSGKTHCVISGYYVRYGEDENEGYDRSEVTFFDLTDEDIDNYVKKFRPLDKAGSYGIQDGVIVKKYDGSLDNIMKLLKPFKSDFNR